MKKESKKSFQINWIDRHPVPDKDAEETPAAPSKRPGKKKTKAPRLMIEEETDMELDLHDCAVDEAMAQVEIALETLKKSGRKRLRVIHGRTYFREGTILFQLDHNLRSIWKKRIFRFYREKNNSGSTIIELKTQSGSHK